MTKVSVYQLIQWKHAIKLEAKGIRVARKSVNAHAGKVFGLGPRAKREVVLEHIEKALLVCARRRAPLEAIMEIETEEAEC